MKVRDFIAHQGQLSENIDLTKAAELQDARGQFGLHQRASDGRHLLARDPLGVNKLFYAVREDGEVETSSFWFELRARHDFDSIWSVPSGHLVTLDPARRQLSSIAYAPLCFNDDGPPSMNAQALVIRDALHASFRALAAGLRGRRIYVSLSGGLDSSGIAALAREHLGAFTAVTVVVGEGGTSEDLTSARRVCEELGVPLETIEVSATAVLGLVDEVLLYGQDWRDFNVHCGLINAAIGAELQRRNAGATEPPVLLTGDVMNELFCDYAPVSYKGMSYYRLPQIPIANLRRSLVGGLDSGDREIGILHHYGVDAIQPYAMCAREYLGLPSAFVATAGAKQALAKAVFADGIPSFVYGRPKTRAQEGGVDKRGGTMSICIDHGLDARWMRARFGELCRTSTDRLDDLIRGGVYRMAQSWPFGKATS